MRVITSSPFVLLAALLQPVWADWQYHSRPDLSPPKLNITVWADSDDVESGLIFVAPYQGFVPGSHGPAQPGAYIFRDNGDLVWSGLGYFGGWTANFRPDVFNGKPMLRATQGLMKERGLMHGNYGILDDNYKFIKSFQARTHHHLSVHEFLVLDGKTVLIESPIPTIHDLKPYGGERGQTWILAGSFQEVDIESGAVLFEWNSLDHVDPTYSALPLKGGRGTSVGYGTSTADAYNYFHINSIAKDDQGHYLISARNYAAIFKINGTSGDVIWQLGGFHNQSSFKIEPDTRFAYQHDARYISRSDDGTIEVISLHDNAAHSIAETISNVSRALYIQLNHTAGTASTLRSYPAPDGLLAYSQGNAQLLPNGNTFANWGQAGAITEFREDGKVLFHAYLDSQPEGQFVQSYRGFRYNWTGTSFEEPAIVALKGQGDDKPVNIYVSWNGDTRATAWRFYAERDSGLNGKFDLGEVTRVGFETHLEVKNLADDEGVHYYAEAVDAEGIILASSKTVSLIDRTFAESNLAAITTSIASHENSQLFFHS
ncbi:hypothetical protein I307_04467 [Cryptococcus deuterogattii 99/473]|uniref:ASST-domain-containing protein n=2 Tax=Cryptococcus deuterogattii TaxID=1859096 RepID=A0A0D0V7I0_9TREE|nr:hypothetical protein CNBG_1183 [Cryptococcus deuterogattii R265]KIR42504.1 hypothetical protein I313_01730 [Cryptococcus deuterogattii Ram5]KIR72670.1 hypothetical protein I310_03270 [Cryptococcus deuterogattii CA1014]KIS00330.1 hypothetical protein L804_01741 [Cryptococcus deuterogattii 2001/935-1]KIY56074.1 hypothetical protein I307_04467 [Cryptococcus deuterogattii 99/473]